ncbi:MAG: DUF134 domain-containing protein [Candidatus Wallbacteria bacterium]|nr:DUF134 domain-containing protein [Candidatus Wallbacteria bacterium]
MSRPVKCRKVEENPTAIYFKPRGIPLQDLQEVVLTIDEFEAVRLIDFCGMHHNDAAEKMGVSRQTAGNIINSAHSKIADVLVNAKALKIEGGAVQITKPE